MPPPTPGPAPGRGPSGAAGAAPLGPLLSGRRSLLPPRPLLGAPRAPRCSPPASPLAGAAARPAAPALAASRARSLAGSLCAALAALPASPARRPPPARPLCALHFPPPPPRRPFPPLAPAPSPLARLWLLLPFAPGSPFPLRRITVPSPKSAATRTTVGVGPFLPAPWPAPNPHEPSGELRTRDLTEVRWAPGA